MKNKNNKEDQLIWESYVTEQVPAAAPQQAPAAAPQQPPAAAPQQAPVADPAAQQPGEEQPPVEDPGAGDYSGYRMIVGQANVRKVAAMMMAINQGKVPNADQLAAYKPAFDLVDNIVKGGYTTLQKIHQLLGLEAPSQSGPAQQ